jgi:formylglycine-generating enzyme required for sulfatase activity/flavodoxin
LGDNNPVYFVSWYDAILYCNLRSKDEGLTPAYYLANADGTESGGTGNGRDVADWETNEDLEIGVNGGKYYFNGTTDNEYLDYSDTGTGDSSGGIRLDLSANGYRLPTEAEWEYACRAGTQTPFNTERSLSAAEANFYGHYPYEIEENYFDNSVLEARPGEYRAKTVAVGSFTPNAWGLYDMHGNVNEWCWDYYGDYDTAAGDNPTGPASGTRHVYRGGGWNDFAKNMRSAYRAAGQEDMRSYNLGLRLVRNADNSRSGFVTAGEAALQAETGGKILIAYFSWSGNTRGIAGEIRKQTGADLFEIRPVHPYSSDYNTVLMEAQEDQHKQARPELEEHLPNMDDYDIIILGYPNWWASIPMPIATFLEEYDLSGKTILPFCSHGGGRFGQSLTAIAKLAPNAVMGTGLSVHYSGGSKLPEDVAAWLSENGIGR